jgi:predicted permease
MFTQTLAVLAPIVFCTGAGYLWKRLGQPFDGKQIALLVTEVGAPCLVLSTLTSINLDKQLILDLGLIVCVAVAGMIALSVIALAVMGLDQKAFSATMYFGNHGYMGMPLCLYAFGETGLALSVIYFTVTMLFHNTLGVTLVSGQLSPRFVLTNPIIIAAFISVVMIFTDTSLPQWLHNSLSITGQFTMPLMLLSLGASLASMTIQHWQRNLTLALMRLGICAMVGYGVAEYFELEGIVRGVVIIEAMMPSAIFNYILAERYHKNPQEVSSVIMLSTFMTFAVLPLIIPTLL